MQLFYIIKLQINPETKTQTSGILLFGLQLESLHQNREKKLVNKAFKSTLQKNTLKLVDEASKSTLQKKAKNVDKKLYKLEYGNEDLIAKKQKCEAVLKTVDQEHIARHVYRSLANIGNELPHKWMIANHKVQINIEMVRKDKITTIKMPLFTKIDQDEHSNIDDPKIVCEIVSSIGKGTQRSIKNILKYIVPNLVKKEILNSQQLVINLRISGNGRNVDKKSSMS
ncbi:hypothetical protein F8M41_019130 [Gigaspora margarita]|uniref:Uncharacterized protein n=1 Tax=Gigaspora margarita TaxID=4874 RepID=A0A8H4AKH9_GIGMA|nr:hypothetical protein F8M41_019130 [Gigaspora margarita]